MAAARLDIHVTAEFPAAEGNRLSYSDKDLGWRGWDTAMSNGISEYAPIRAVPDCQAD